MKNINLHIHSDESLDGKQNIVEIANECIQNEVDCMSITDHDNCDAYLKLDPDKITGEITIIYGMEADVIIDGKTYDILCYGFELSKVREWAKKQYGTIEERQRKIYEELIKKCHYLNLNLDTKEPYDATKEFAHAAVFRMLKSIQKNNSFLEKYKIQNYNDFYRMSTMDKTFPLYVDMSIIWPNIEKLKKIIHENGGKLFLAHPYKYEKSTDVESILNRCRKYIDGIEISNNPKNKEEVQMLYTYAKEHNLLICAGSDYHGTKNHGTMVTEYLTDEMKEHINDWVDNLSGKINIRNKENKNIK